MNLLFAYLHFMLSAMNAVLAYTCFTTDSPIIGSLALGVSMTTACLGFFYTKDCFSN